MNKLIIVILSILLLTACKTTIEYRDREVYIPKIVLETCIKEQVETECSIEINTYRDLAQCYIELKENVIFINNIIEKCNIQKNNP